jgi:hypothetical protein
VSPVARPTASSQRRQSARTVPGFVQISAASVWPQPDSLPVRLSASQLQQIDAELLDRDRLVLAFLGEARLATGGQIARRWWQSTSPSDPAARACRRTIARLERLRVIARIARRHGGVRGGSSSIIYGVGVAGRRLLEPDAVPRLGTPSLLHTTHTIAITELAVRLAEAERRGQIAARGVQFEPQCHRSFLAGFGARIILKPDLFVGVAAGHDAEDLWFIEVDLATHATTSIRRAAQRYLAHLQSGPEQREHGIYPRVVFTAPNPHRAQQLQRVLASTNPPSPRLFSVWPYDEVVGRLAAEART